MSNQKECHCSTILGRILSIFYLLSFLFLSEQNETKHDSSSSPGMTDQEKEVAASAYEAFLVIHLSYSDSQFNDFD